MKTHKHLTLTTILVFAIIIAITAIILTACDNGNNNGGSDPKCECANNEHEQQCSCSLANCGCTVKQPETKCGVCGQPESSCTCNEIEQPWSGNVGGIAVSKSDDIEKADAQAFLPTITTALSGLGASGVTIVIEEGNLIIKDGNVIKIGIEDTSAAIKIFFIDNVIDPQTYSIRGIPVNFANGIKNSEKDAEFELLDDGVEELTDAEEALIKNNVSKITIGNANGLNKVGDKWEVTIARGQEGIAIAGLLRGYATDIQNIIDPACNCVETEKYLPCECGKRDCNCTVKAFGQLDALLFDSRSEQIPVYMTPGVTEAQMAGVDGALARIQAGYTNLNDANKDALFGKIKENLRHLAGILRRNCHCRRTDKVRRHIRRGKLLKGEPGKMVLDHFVLDLFGAEVFAQSGNLFHGKTAVIGENKIFRNTERFFQFPDSLGFAFLYFFSYNSHIFLLLLVRHGNPHARPHCRRD